MTYNLGSLKCGDVGVIHRIAAHDGRAKRLADMGFVCGARVKVVRTGHACIVQLADARIGLGAPHQASIEVST